MSHAVIQADKSSLAEMKAHYQEHLKNNPPQYASFAAKLGKVTITAYQSGKVVFQGEGAESEASKWGKLAASDDETSSSQSSSLPADFAKWSIIGSDEVGTGSYFGPLTVCAAYVDKEQIPLLKELGVKDSKNLTDSQITSIAKDLISFLPYSLLKVMPEKYNSIQRRMSQGKMKAVLHNQALIHVLNKINPKRPEAILIDQFELPSTYKKHISDQDQQVLDQVYFETKGESRHIAVAAASIIARYAFLDSLDQMSQKAGFKIPSGANKEADIAAAKLLKKGGLSLLGQYAKLHFANTEKAQELLK